ncbi:MAG: hypothetical protein WA775_10175 [Psychroserpens sp.]|uniref:hypothetical protein n=1 Tax=Psychroserpens sp. TaxID=2020870 RepID=UPI003C9E7601
MIITVPLVVFMSITFVLVFLFVKTIDPRKWLTFLVSLALTPVVYFYAVYPMINIFSSYHHQKHFSAEVWKAKPALRYELSDDMITSEILLGMTKNDIKAQLGAYEWLSWNDAEKKHNENRWNYSLGIEPGAFNQKKQCIELQFSDQKVTKVKPYKEDIEPNAKD